MRAGGTGLLTISRSQAYAGEYQCWAGALPLGASDVQPGEQWNITAASWGLSFPAIVRQVEIAFPNLSDEYAQFHLRFANDAAQPFTIHSVRSQHNALLTVVSSNLQDNVSTRPAGLPDARITTWSATAMTLDVGTAPLPGGGIEVRVEGDWGWGNDQQPESAGPLYQPDDYLALYRGNPDPLSAAVRRQHSAAVFTLFERAESGSVTMTNFEERVLAGSRRVESAYALDRRQRQRRKNSGTGSQNPETRSGAATHRRARCGRRNIADHHAPCAGLDKGDTSLMTKQEFVRQAYAAAIQSSKQSGMPAMVTVAQAALESNWGQSKLSIQANNYFGIKAHGTHARVQMPTEECENGVTVAVEAEFAKYLSMLDCFQCQGSNSSARRGLRRGARKAQRRSRFHRRDRQALGD